MLSVPQALAMAWRSYQAGQWQQAEQILKQVVQVDAGQAHTWQVLGATLHMQGKLDEAVASYQQVLRLMPDSAEAHMNLALTLQMQRNLDQAVAHYQEALRLRPDFVEAHINLGNALREQGKPAEAVVVLKRALQLMPSAAQAYLNLAAALQALGELGQAAACLEQALHLRPDDAELHYHQGNVLHQQGNLAGAALSFANALRLRPNFAPAHNNLGCTLRQQRRPAEAVLSFENALNVDPNYADAWCNLGNAWHDQDRLADAIASYEKALRLVPDFADAYYNLGNALQRQGRYAEASTHLAEAVRLRPDFAEARYYLSALALLHGDFERGWAGFDLRWHLHDFPAAPRQGPHWDGGPLEGKTILLYAEQGLGDTLQFIRYAALVKERGATVAAACQGALLGVLSGYSGIDHLLAQEEPAPRCDMQAALLSLPALCGTTLATIPAKVPYLVAQPSRVQYWQEQMAGVPGFKIGFCWQGNPANLHDRQRSVPLERFAPLAEVPGVRLVCLQKGPGREQWDTLADRWPTVPLPPQADEPAEGWVDTAALVCALDLVVTVDTAVAHLAGALGVAVWVALPFVPDWRWLLGREDSPWYPSMRLFRQTQPGDWADVFERIRDALQIRENRPR